MVSKAEKGIQDHSPLDSLEFERLLKGYDTEKADYVISGIKYGFHIGYQGSLVCDNCQNSPLIDQYLEEAQKLIQKEVDLGRVAGPYYKLPFEHLHLSPLTIRPKPTPGEYRLIHNLTAPYDLSAINLCIPETLKTVQYESVSNIISHLLTIGQGAYLAKSDVKSAFRLVPVHSSCYHLLGFKFKGGLYFDKCLAMGAGTSCRIFESIPTAVNWILREKFGIQNSFHYLDDFLFIEDTYEKCKYDLEVFKVVCKRLGVILSPDKTKEPDTKMCFLGIELDSRAMTARIPEDKLIKYRALIEEALEAPFLTQAQVKSVIGCLNWCVNIVTTGRAFLRRLHDLVLGDHEPKKIVVLTVEMRKDLEMWKNFLDSFNGRVFIDYMPVESSESLNFYTDASYMGAGGTFKSQWFQIRYPEHWAERRITYLELYPIVVAAHIFVQELRGKKVIFHTDNYAVMTILNKCTSPNPKFMPLVRKLVILAMKNRIKFCSKHVKGTCNSIADAISRFQVTDQFLAANSLSHIPQKIPMDWIPQSWEILEPTY